MVESYWALCAVIKDQLVILAICLAALAAEATEAFDFNVPHPFTSLEGGRTRCFIGYGCYGPPPGGWAWEAEDVDTFVASAPLARFDPNRPQSYRSRDGGQTRCF